MSLSPVAVVNENVMKAISLTNSNFEGFDSEKARMKK
jgi:hypothetical protein